MVAFWVHLGYELIHANLPLMPILWMDPSLCGGKAVKFRFQRDWPSCFPIIKSLPLGYTNASLM